MKGRKIQFRLSTIFVAVAILGIGLSIYRYHLYVEERILFHRKELSTAEFTLETKMRGLSVLLESREALLAGDEDRLARSTLDGQIVNAPHQLIAVDNAVLDLKDVIAQEEVIKKYHTDMIAEFEYARWRPWRRVGELSSPPASLHVEQKPVPPARQPGGGQQKEANEPKK